MLALLFPGQGSQAVGMGKPLAERFATPRSVFARAKLAEISLADPSLPVVTNGEAAPNQDGDPC